MWNRADLKANAKKIFFGNYWKAVLVTLILTIILGGATNTITRRISNNQSTDWSIDQDFSGVSSYDEWSNDEILNIGNSSLYGSEYQTYLRIYNRLKNIPGSVWAMLGIAVAVGIVVGLLISIFLVAPLQVGCYRWYILNRTSNPPMGELLNSFRNGYFNTAKIMFCKGLYTTLWSLLFIIPGIIKAYEYSMIPYLLAENPNMSKQEAFAISKELMDGNKFNAFVLDLSFILWNFVGALALGLPGVFFVNPYVQLTNVELYVKLCQIRAEGHNSTYNQDYNQNFNQDDFNFQGKMKSAIFNNLEEDQELSPEKLADQLFDNNLTARLTFVDELKEAIPEPISVSDIDHSRQIKKLENQKLSLSNGIELIVPNNVYQDADSVEFIQNPDGTYSILIKNIEDIINK